MSRTIINDEGVEEILYTQEELDIIRGEKEQTEKKYQELEAHTANQSKNFKMLRDMSSEEISKMSAQQIELQKITEKALEEAKIANQNIEEMKKFSEQSRREIAISKIAGNNPEIRKVIEEKLAFVTMPDIEDSVRAAAAIAGISIQQEQSPVFADYSGEAPAKRVQDEKNAFLESDKAKAALKAMGM